jgi:hypothetical protein
MDLATRSLINSALITSFGVVLSFLATWFWFQRNLAFKKADELAGAQVKLLARVSELESQSSLLKQQVTPIAAAFQAILVRELTHFHTPVMDALLVKLGPPNTLTDEEEQELADALEQRTKDMGDQITDSERDAAQMLPFLIRRAKREERVGPNHKEVMLVSTVAPPPNNTQEHQ